MSCKRGIIAFTTGFPAALCVLGTLIPFRSHAETMEDQWQWAATVYLWLPSLGGETSFPPDGDGPSIDVTGDAILDSLEGTFMGAFEGRTGPWGLATDIVYIDLGASKKATRDFGIGHIDIPATVNADLSLDVTGWLWTLTGSYAVTQREDFSMDVLAGARMLDLQEDLKWTFHGDISSLPLTERSGSSDAKDNQWDAIVGLKGRVAFGADDAWFIPFHVDIGAGESDLTWQGLVGLGYRFDSVEVKAVWRYLDYDLGNHTPIQSIDFNGPAAGVTFRF